MVANSINAATREELISSATAAWILGQDNASASIPLASVGATLDSAASGIGAHRARPVATLSNGYFNAGNRVSLSSEEMTVYLRAYDPTGTWSSGLVAKRGSLSTLNYNLFSADLAGSEGPDIGFEVRTTSGLYQVSFPVSRVGSAVWLDLVGRYDGRRLQVFCNGRLMAERSCVGALRTNTEPLLIGAETDGGSVTRRFTGQLDEAAIFDRALSDAEVATLCRTPKIWATPATTVHHRQPSHPVGDFRPHFVDGEFVVQYLYNPGTWNTAILRSRDLLNWRQSVPTHAPATGNQEVPNYFVLSFLKDPLEDRWRTFYGSGSGFRSSVSTDLETWTAASPQLLIPSRPQLYARESDPFVFWNPDRNQYWMVMTLGKANVPTNQRGAVGWATSTDLRSWINRGELYSPGNLGDPECPSMFKMGDTWYLLASYYDRAVGAPVYRMSSAPEGPWGAAVPDRLDGKDFCAGFSVDADGRRVMFGWIPANVSQPGNQAWGGHMAFPREIVPFAGGSLGTRLVVEFDRNLMGPPLLNVLRPHTGTWNISEGHAAATTPFQEGVAAFEGTVGRVILSTDLEFSPTSRSVRVLLDWTPSSSSVAVVIDRQNKRLAIEGPGGAVYADLPLREVVAGIHPFKMYVEEDMVEVFFGGRYSLVARVPKKFSATSLALSADSGPTTFHNLSLNHFNDLMEATEESKNDPNGWLLR